MRFQSHLPVFLSSRSSSRPPYYPRESDYPPQHEREVPRVEHHDSKCTNICSRRGKAGSEWRYLCQKELKALLEEAESAASHRADFSFTLKCSSELPPASMKYWTDWFSCVYRPLFLNWTADHLIPEFSK